jgi:long-chain acyl-CoA synthetase
MQRLVQWTAELGWRRFEAAPGRGKCLSVGQWLLCVVLQWLVAREIRDKLGGRLQVCASGGAALAPELARWFFGMGLTLLQGYGLTEAAPVVSHTATDINRHPSVLRSRAWVAARRTR